MGGGREEKRQKEGLAELGEDRSGVGGHMMPGGELGSVGSARRS
jgi:hypothetical protein